MSCIYVLHATHIIHICPTRNTCHPSRKTYVLAPDCSVGVQEEGEVVADKVLATDAQVDRVPIAEFVAHELERLTGDGGVGRDLE